MEKINIYNDKIYIPSIGKYLDLGLSCEQLNVSIKTLQCVYKKKIENLEINTEEINILDTINNNTDSILDYYMPILNNKTLKIEKYEALVRLNLGGKIISPFGFLPLIENTPLELKISGIMLEKTIQKLKENPLIKIGLNINSNDLVNDDYINKMKNLLQKNNIEKGRLNVELLETVSSTNNNKNLEDIIKIFNSFGVNVYIDDMGTGNSNINRLLHVKNIHMVKIDGGIIQGLSTKNLEGESDDKKEKRIEKSAEIITLIVQITEFQNPKQKVIAEYVSSKEIFEKVKKLGIHYSQGYYIGEATKDLIGIDSFIEKTEI